MIGMRDSVQTMNDEFTDQSSVFSNPGGAPDKENKAVENELIT